MIHSVAALHSTLHDRFSDSPLDRLDESATH